MPDKPLPFIAIHADAPAKPAFGVTCNGCGACCALEPCPVAYVLLFQFKGACRALTWHAETARYRCGLVERPDTFVWWVPRRLRNSVGRFVLKRIAAGVGCDFDAEALHEP